MNSAAVTFLLTVALGRAASLAEESSLEESCTLPYWRRAQELLLPSGTREPAPEALDQLLAEESELSSGELSAGCERGRFFVSSWRLLQGEREERAWHLQTRRFGQGFFALPWRPREPWPVFSGLARLRERVREDFEGEAEDFCGDMGEAEAEFLAKLEAALSGGGEVPAAAAASFLLLAREGSTCPLAVAAAYWTVAASLARAGSRASEVEELVSRGEVAVKEAQRLSFLDLLTTAWPLWDLLAEVELHLVFSQDRAGSSAAADGPRALSAPPLEQSLDPLQPTCRPQSRSLSQKGLEQQRVEAVVVYGRRDRAEILHRYLLRNLRVNGGLLDKVSFVVFVAMEEDLRFLQQIVAAHAPFYEIPPVTGRRLAKIYSICREPETIYIKIDDDIVYVADEAIATMVRERQRDRCSVVSANVVNHAILSAVHQDIGALRSFFPDEDPSSRWLRADDELPLAAITKHAQSDCVWKWWQCAAWMHESLLSRLEDGTECAYDFGWHDFHAHGHGTFKGEKFVPFAYTRWSINMIAFTAADLEHASLEELAEDDESELAVMVQHRSGRRACAVGRALVAHFSYALQEEGLSGNTDLLARYRNLSLVRARSPRAR